MNVILWTAHNPLARLVILFCLTLPGILSLAGCAARETPPRPAAVSGQILDLTTLPQDLAVYAAAVPTSGPLLSAQDQAAHNARFDRLFFNPWRASKAGIPAKDVFALLRREPAGYAENLLPWQKRRWNALLRNADEGAYPSRLEKALTVVRTSLRAMPTALPRFAHPEKPGQGFPFDLTQTTALPPGMPVLLTHLTRDGAWAYAETALAGGWIPTRDVAVTDTDFRERYRTGRYAAILRDGVPLRDAAGRLIALADLGAVFPVQDVRADGSLQLLVPMRNPDGTALPATCTVGADDAAIKPLPLTPGRLAALGNPVLGQPYGWGGLFGNRDCSALMRDLFTPFGIWLPRNSAAQARAWTYTDFGDASASAKEQRILAEGVPFATLLWLPGHIALYVGEHNGKAAMLHNMWGVRTVRPGQASGRHIVGRTVITSTRPGTELPTVEDREGLLNRMKGMSVLR